MSTPPEQLEDRCRHAPLAKTPTRPFACCDIGCAQFLARGSHWGQVLANGRLGLERNRGCTAEDHATDAGTPFGDEHYWYLSGSFINDVKNAPRFHFNLRELLLYPLSLVVLLATSSPRDLAFLLVALAQCVSALDYRSLSEEELDAYRLGMMQRLLTLFMAVRRFVPPACCQQFLRVARSTFFHAGALGDEPFIVDFPLLSGLKAFDPARPGAEHEHLQRIYPDEWPDFPGRRLANLLAAWGVELVALPGVQVRRIQLQSKEALAALDTRMQALAAEMAAQKLVGFDVETDACPPLRDKADREESVLQFAWELHPASKARPRWKALVLDLGKFESHPSLRHLLTHFFETFLTRAAEDVLPRLLHWGGNERKGFAGLMARFGVDKNLAGFDSFVDVGAMVGGNLQQRLFEMYGAFHCKHFQVWAYLRGAMPEAAIRYNALDAVGVLRLHLDRDKKLQRRWEDHDFCGLGPKGTRKEKLRWHRKRDLWQRLAKRENRGPPQRADERTYAGTVVAELTPVRSLFQLAGGSPDMEGLIVALERKACRWKAFLALLKERFERLARGRLTLHGHLTMRTKEMYAAFNAAWPNLELARTQAISKAPGALGTAAVEEEEEEAPALMCIEKPQFRPRQPSPIHEEDEQAEESGSPSRTQQPRRPGSQRPSEGAPVDARRNDLRPPEGFPAPDSQLPQHRAQPPRSPRPQNYLPDFPT